MIKLRLLGFLVSSLFVVTLVDAQQVNLGLYETAVPDSFEVRAFSTGADIEGFISSLTLSIRWESAAGGVMSATDIEDACAGSPILSTGGVHDLLGWRYATLNVFQLRPLGEDCGITSSGTVLFGFRIRELGGCRNVLLVGNAFTGLNNLDYYLSVNGFDVTGEILTAPISSGDCPPCEPPVITDAGAGPVPYCGFGVNLWVEASGTLPDLSWYRPNGSLLSWQPQVYSPTGPAGLYTVVASNACGADTAQVEALVDTGLCVPPAIDSVWFHPGVGGGQGAFPRIQLYASATGNCLSYMWTMPWGEVLPMNPEIGLTVGNPTEGNYTLVTSNACGSDTLVLFVEPPDPCVGPVVSNAGVTVQDSCHTGYVVFDVGVSGLGPITTRWYGPDGLLITGSPHFGLPYAPWGTYTFTASNFCRTDTVTVFHGPADTTGLAACEQPQILSITASSVVACLGDTLDIVSSTFLTGPCASLVWSNAEVLSTSGDTVRVLLNYGDPVMLTATNGCGQVTQEVPIDVIYPKVIHRNQCRVTGPLSIDSLVALYIPMPEGGQWWLEGVPHSGIYDPAVDTSGMYQYYMDTSGVYCKVVEFGLHEFPGVYAGEDTSIVVCSTDPPFLLFIMLGGTPQTGGNWRYGMQPASSTFDPAASAPGTYTYRLSTMASGGGCSDMAEVNVAVTPASTWYADLDGDGLGDPADTLLACEQPLDHVAVAGDECPEIFGTVGDPCDDEDPNTHNDVVGADCVCEGELGVGISEWGQGRSVLWPNPNGSDAFFLKLPMEYGHTTILLADATGRNLLRKSVVASSSPIKVDLPATLAAGTYTLSIASDRGFEAKRFVIVR